jgi:pre-60S factor REI1
MKTDWHRYNLKRRVASLPPVDAVIYAEKVQQSKQFQDETDEFGFKVMKPKEKRLHISKPHGRGRIVEVVHQEVQRELSPSSVTSELSHLSMGESVYSHPATHTDLESNFETGSERTMESDEDYTDEEEVETDDDDNFDDNDDYEEEPLQPITSCIYCGIPHREIEQNVSHMFKSHGLYIPERSYLVDLKGLLEYLISVIVIDNECLCCNFQGKNLESIRAHVSSKGHCRLPYESKEERALFAKFYDFSSADEVAPKSKSNKSVGFNEDNMQISDEGDDSEDNGINNNYTLATIDPDISALNLPNGSRLGHRSLQRIYRQHTHTPRESVESQLTVMSADKRFGGLTSMEYKKEVIQPKLIEQRDQNKFLRKETKKRINFQSHFRDQMLGG